MYLSALTAEFFLYIYINGSDIRMIKMIVNVNTALVPVLPPFWKEDFPWTQVQVGFGLFFKNFEETREEQSQRRKVSNAHCRGLQTYTSISMLDW